MPTKSKSNKKTKIGNLKKWCKKLHLLAVTYCIIAFKNFYYISIVCMYCQ